MDICKFEYIWIDGCKPSSSIRSKVMIKEMESFNDDPEILPQWVFDGSSTQQAKGFASDCILKPVRVYKDPFRTNTFLVLCEVFNADHSPHITNTRTLINNFNQEDFWFGFEQEYVLMTPGHGPLGFPCGGFPKPQGPYYCALGHQNVAGRHLIEEHMEACISAGVCIVGTNAEVMLGQWEYQIFGKGAKLASDDLLISRFLLYRISEKYNVIVELHPKPIKGDWNGSGLHTNFSNSYMRERGGKEYIEAIASGFKDYHKDHIPLYGAYNDERLTGQHETASMEKFTYGISDRGASIRIPLYTIEHGWKGYLEDRRPASNADPYLVTNCIMKTVNEIHQKIIG